ncbi:MAG: S1 RNA-binding domain-containing protein [Oscillospiraceae bacterium]|jgi:S1 RNA binding domain protein|nr:S1 RNA-binding domain-containing protein [Oscillospiraceae bacterium]
MQLEVGTVLEGKVTGITKFGAFVELPGGKTGMVHISEVAPTFVKEIRDFVSENQMIKVKILNITPEGKISLSMKRVAEPAKPSGGAAPRRRTRPGNYEWQPSRRSAPTNFEDMLSKFKQTSDEKMLDLKRCMESKRGGFSRHGGGSNQAK